MGEGQRARHGDPDTILRYEAQGTSTTRHVHFHGIDDRPRVEVVRVGAKCPVWHAHTFPRNANLLPHNRRWTLAGLKPAGLYTSGGVNDAERVILLLAEALQTDPCADAVGHSDGALASKGFRPLDRRDRNPRHEGCQSRAYTAVNFDAGRRDGGPRHLRCALDPTGWRSARHQRHDLVKHILHGRRFAWDRDSHKIGSLMFILLLWGRLCRGGGRRRRRRASHGAGCSWFIDGLRTHILGMDHRLYSDTAPKIAPRELSEDDGVPWDECRHPTATTGTLLDDKAGAQDDDFGPLAELVLNTFMNLGGNALVHKRVNHVRGLPELVRRTRNGNRVAVLLLQREGAKKTSKGQVALVEVAPRDHYGSRGFREQRAALCDHQAHLLDLERRAMHLQRRVKLIRVHKFRRRFRRLRCCWFRVRRHEFGRS
mmetsp:Transcript_54001/g.150185  ORF Transcript_54001/g.150185 Transcript_54001/m.150185 type:complete len:427 (+) Transcript_54001:564-1844(+)